MLAAVPGSGSQDVPSAASIEEVPGPEKISDDGETPSAVVVAEANALEPKKKDADDDILSVKEIEKASSPLPAAEESWTLASLTDQSAGKALESVQPEKQCEPLHDSAERGALAPPANDMIDQEFLLTQIKSSPEVLAPPTMADVSSARPASAYATTDFTDTPKASMPNIPISAIRPGFSRHTSSKSASPFRGNSPFRRDQSQTPGSESRSRPLSMIWGDWLRDKTRSVSRSGSSRRGSRPVSLMLDNNKGDESAASSSLAVGRSSELTLGDLSDVAVFSNATTASMDMPKRTETWNSPDATLPPRTPETRELVLERLGILPSPAPTSMTFESLGSGRRRRRSSAARLGSAAGLEGLGLDLETVPSQDSGESPVLTPTAGSAGRGSPVRSATVGLRKVSEAEEVVVMRPRQQRRVSDLELLPSEQKRLSLGQGMPRPDSMTLLQSQVDLLAGVGQHGNDDGDGAQLDRSHERVGESDAMPGAEERESSQLAVQKSRPATGNSSSQVTADEWDDARSEVSAEDGAADDLQRASTNPATSRHSSVSSLGGADTASASVSQRAVEESTMSAQAVPAGPVPSATVSPTTAAPGSQAKPQRPQMLDRPMSYMVLPRDESGLPVPETITTASLQNSDTTTSLLQKADTTPLQQIDTSAPLQQINTTASLQQTNTLSSNESPVAVDLSAMSGPPPGTPPFQQHPVFRNSVVQAEPQEDPQKAVPIGATVGALQSQGAADGGDTKTKRQSGFFGKQPPAEYPTFGGAPPPNRITDQHGLEDLHESDDEVVPDIQQRPKARQPVETQSRRRSGFWDVLTAKRASSGAKLDIGGEYNADPLSADVKAREESGKRKLQKPQRASSSAVDLEPKKKRFSALGSIFGRSGTTGHGSPKPNKLTKMVPSSSDNVNRMGSPREARPANSSTVSGNVRGYDEFEARRNQDPPAYQNTAANIRPAAFNGGQERAVRPVDTAPAHPPPEGWYGPSAVQQPVQQPYFAPADNPQPQFRRLHSQGRVSGRPQTQVPPAFRPVEASFTAPVAPVGPLPDPRNMQNPRTSPERIPVQDRDVPINRQNSYGSSYGSEFSGFSGQQVAAARAQQYPPSQRAFGPDVSPILTRAGPPTVQAQRVISAGYETARSPAKDYPDQQTPWAITIPPGQSSTRTSRASSWGMAPEGTQYPGPPPDAPYHQQQQHPPQQQYPNSSNAPYRPISQGRGQVPRSYSNGPGAYAPPYAFEPPQQYQYPYSNAPQHMQTQFPYSQQQYGHAQQNPRQQSRYYSQQTSAPPQNAYHGQTSQQYDSRIHQRRRSSGYSGRRDDMTAGEEDLIMRGVSYPGQEWQPPGLGRSGWD